MHKSKYIGRWQNRDPTKWQIAVVSFGKMFCKTAVLLFLFYGSVLFALVSGVLMGAYGIRKSRRDAKRQMQERMNLELREGLQGIAAALHAGYSVENAFAEAEKDLQLLYGGSSVLVPELQKLSGKLQLNHPVEEALFELAERSGIEDIRRFAEIFQTAKRMGGNLLAVTRTTANRISEKIEVKREISAMIAGKKMEAEIMKAIPVGMIVYFRICSPGFLDPLYRGEGRIVMTVLLLLYLIAYFWSERIIRIDV